MPNKLTKNIHAETIYFKHLNLSDLNILHILENEISDCELDYRIVRSIVEKCKSRADDFVRYVIEALRNEFSEAIEAVVEQEEKTTMEVVSDSVVSGFQRICESLYEIAQGWLWGKAVGTVGSIPVNITSSTLLPFSSSVAQQNTEALGHAGALMGAAIAISSEKERYDKEAVTKQRNNRLVATIKFLRHYVAWDDFSKIFSYIAESLFYRYSMFIYFIDNGEENDISRLATFFVKIIVESLKSSKLMGVKGDGTFDEALLSIGQSEGEDEGGKCLHKFLDRMVSMASPNNDKDEILEKIFNKGSFSITFNSREDIFKKDVTTIKLFREWHRRKINLFNSMKRPDLEKIQSFFFEFSSFKPGMFSHFATKGHSFSFRGMINHSKSFCKKTKLAYRPCNRLFSSSGKKYPVKYISQEEGRPEAYYNCTPEFYPSESDLYLVKRLLLFFRADKTAKKISPDVCAYSFKGVFSLLSTLNEEIKGEDIQQEDSLYDCIMMVMVDLKSKFPDLFLDGDLASIQLDRLKILLDNLSYEQHDSLSNSTTPTKKCSGKKSERVVPVSDGVVDTIIQEKFLGNDVEERPLQREVSSVELLPRDDDYNIKWSSGPTGLQKDGCDDFKSECNSVKDEDNSVDVLSGSYAGRKGGNRFGVFQYDLDDCSSQPKTSTVKRQDASKTVIF